MKTKMVGLLLLLSCCGQQKVSRDISELRDKLPQLQTPLSFNSDRMVKWKSIELPANGLISKLKERNSFTLIGKVFETKSNVTILGYIPDDIGTPVLITYDNNGNELSTHVIFETAVSDMGHYTTNIVDINPDKRILFTAITTTREINKEGTDEISGTDSISATHKEYILNEKGIIERLN